MIKAVIFDFFGVLYPDTFWQLADIYVPTRDEAKREALHDLIKRVDLGHINQAQFWAGAAAEFGTTVEQLNADKSKLGKIDNQLMEIVAKLKKMGIKTGIISNVGPGVIEKSLGNIHEYFDVIVISGEEFVVKPDKRIYDIAVGRLGVSAAECIFFDDIESNVEGARGVGMSGVLYRGIDDCIAALKGAWIL